MAVYVSALPLGANPRGGRYKVCAKLTGTDLEELHQFAAALHLSKSWFKPATASRYAHYPITGGKRLEAVKLGARAVAQERLLERHKKGELA